jgi:NADH-quinone oxidoreductase subunit F
MSGSAGLIVMDDSTCMVRVLARIAKFYAEESCGQCTPCREGTSWMEGIVERIEHGHGQPGDVDKLAQVAGNIGGQTICALGDAASMPVQSFVKKFREEFELHVRERRCPFPHPWGATLSARPAYVGPVRMG